MGLCEPQGFVTLLTQHILQTAVTDYVKFLEGHAELMILCAAEKESTTFWIFSNKTT